MTNKPGRPTIRDVGRAANVSYAAASYVLSGSKYAARITPDTQQRILDAAQRLGYVRSTVGVALTRGYSDTVVLLVVSWDIITSLADLAIAITQAAASKGLTTIVHMANDSADANAFLRVVPSLHPFGMLLLWDSTQIQDDQISQIRALGIPVADLMPPGPLCDAVVTADRQQAFYLIGRHLAELGHRHVGVIEDFHSYARTTQPKLAGLRRALEESGITHDEDLLQNVDADVFQIGTSGVRELLSRRRETTAIACLADNTAYAAMAAARELGLRVPEDLSVTGYGAHNESRFYNPPLTTTSVPTRRIAEAAIDALTRLRAGEPVEPAVRTVGPSELLPGGSTAPARTWDLDIGI